MTIPDIFEARLLEAGGLCSRCRQEILAGQRVGRCPDCNHLQHEECWQEGAACYSEGCEKTAQAPPGRREPDLIVTREDVARAPASPVRPGGFASPGYAPDSPERKRLSALSVAALVCSLLALPLLGFPGLVAIGLGALAIGSINTRKDLRGNGFAAAGIIVGILAILGWAVVGVVFLTSRQAAPARWKYPVLPPSRGLPSLEELAEMPQAIRRAIRANVLVVVRGAGRTSEGSGVVLQSSPGEALIITSRHVVGDDWDAAHQLPAMEITFANGKKVKGTVRWVGPDGVESLELMSKREVADRILDRVAALLPGREAQRS